MERPFKRLGTLPSFSHPRAHARTPSDDARARGERLRARVQYAAHTQSKYARMHNKQLIGSRSARARVCKALHLACMPKFTSERAIARACLPARTSQ